MYLIEKLKEQNHFTDAERVLANYILDHLQEISMMTIYKLSENSFCSVATISRFCKKLKMKNFNSLKLELVKECSNYEENSPKITYDYPFSKDDSEEEITKKIHKLCIQTLNDSYASINIEDIHNAAILLDKAHTIDIYANCNSIVSALNLHSKLLWMGKNSIFENLRGFQAVKASISDENHVAVIISYYGQTDGNMQIAKRLNDNNTPYILITGPKLNPLCLNAKQVIHLPPEEEFSDKIATFSSVIALDYVINILYSFLFALHYDKNMNNRYNIAIAKYKKTKE